MLTLFLYQFKAMGTWERKWVRGITFMWNFLVPLDQPDVIQRPDFRRGSAVDAKDLVINESCHGEHVEDSAAVAPASVHEVAQEVCPELRRRFG